jgi:hypothetical protein
MKRFLKLAISSLILLNSVRAEVKVATLKIGLNEYKSATVTLESSDQAKIVHDSGIARVKTSELPAEIQEQIGFKFEAEKAAEASARLDREYPIERKSVTNSQFSDKWIREELNRFLDSRPDGKVFALTIEITDNPRMKQSIKVIFDRQKKVLLHLWRSNPSLAAQAQYDLVRWSGMTREKLREGIPWMDDNFKPLGTSENGISPLELQWSCESRPEIATWP